MHKSFRDPNTMKDHEYNKANDAKYAWHECPDCAGSGHTECCGTGCVQWPEIPMCSDCKEWSIDECETCKGMGEVR